MEIETVVISITLPYMSFICREMEGGWFRPANRGRGQSRTAKWEPNCLWVPFGGCVRRIDIYGIDMKVGVTMT